MLIVLITSFIQLRIISCWMTTYCCLISNASIFLNKKKIIVIKFVANKSIILILILVFEYRFSIFFLLDFQCYTCKDQTCQSQELTTCSSDSHYCMSTVKQDQQGGRIVTKGYVTNILKSLYIKLIVSNFSRLKSNLLRKLALLTFFTLKQINCKMNIIYPKQVCNGWCV